MITIILPVSRSSFLKQVFESLDKLDCDREQVSIFVYVDGDLQLFEIAQQLVSECRFKNKRIVYRRKGMPNISHIFNRRKRIADIHNEIKELIDPCDFVFVLEDDTLIQPDTLVKLMQIYDTHPDAGFVSGVQIGRWGFNHIGAWLFNGFQITSVPRGEGVIEVSAAGLYCCLMRTTTYKEHYFTPFEKILGPDFELGIRLQDRGIKNYLDYSVECKHLTKRGAIDFTNTEVVQVWFLKDQENQWLLQGEL